MLIIITIDIKALADSYVCTISNTEWKKEKKNIRTENIIVSISPVGIKDGCVRIQFDFIQMQGDISHITIFNFYRLW